MFGYTELRTRSYQSEARGYCNKCAVFLDVGQPKNPNLKYLPKEEFEKIKDHIADDSVLNVMSMDQILSILLAIKDFEQAVKYFMDQKDKTDPTVKFFGEMIPSGIYQDYISPEDRHTQNFQSLHQCSNPSCKYEIPIVMKAPRYPYIDTVVGRMVRSPDELQHPDDVIKNVMKKHIGSTVTPNFQEQPQKVENEPEKKPAVEETVEKREENTEGT